MSDAILKRLEAVASKLEAFAASGAVGSASSSSSSAAPAAGGAKLDAYDALVKTSIQPFIDAANAVPGTQIVGKSAATGVAFVRTVLAAAESSKKPSDGDFGKFLAPQLKVVEAGSNPDTRSESANALQAWRDGQNGLLLWVQVNPTTFGMTPKQFVQEMLEAADFYLIKVLTDAKKSGNAAVGAFATTFKAAMQALGAFVQANYPTGLEWNPKGGDLLSFSGSSSSAPSAPAAPGAPAPPGPPSAPGAPSAPGGPSSFAPSAKPVTSGMGAVFDQLNSKGDGVTGGLKKVTDDMKTKNLKDKPVLDASAKKPVAAAPKAAASSSSGPAKEARTYLSKGTWFVEHVEGKHDIKLEGVEIKENIYILKCKDATINIPDKCKSISVDNCNKITVVFKSVVSVFEIFNSQRVKIECEEYVPSVAVDKSAGVSVTLSRAAVKEPPTLITSSITEMNLVVPGKSDEDDPVEIPLPEQYETKLLPGQYKLATEAVSHSGN